MPIPLISEEVVSLCLSGASLLVGSRDGSLLPECARGVGLAFAEDRQHLTVYLPEATIGKMARNFADNAQIAIGISVPIDHRSLQFKGQVLKAERAPEPALATITAYLERYAEALVVIGLPRDVIMRVNHWPALAVLVRVDELFVQTPGPGAGAQLSRGGSL